MVIRNYTHDQIKQTFLTGSLSNIETVISYNLYEMSDLVARQMGKPSVEDARTWQMWLDQRIDSSTPDVRRLWMNIKFWIDEQ